jgi:nickel transport protein
VIRTAALAGAAALALAAMPAVAHETLHDVERGRALALRARLADGEVLAYAPYEVYSPADRKIPWQKGRTDRAGWLAFVPGVPGKWRVKVIDETGHGLDVEIEAAPPAAAATPPPGAVPALAFVLRPLLGLAAIGAVFAALYLAHRRRRSTP